jgi:hypothetical protein
MEYLSSGADLYPAPLGQTNYYGFTLMWFSTLMIRQLYPFPSCRCIGSEESCDGNSPSLTVSVCSLP